MPPSSITGIEARITLIAYFYCSYICFGRFLFGYDSVYINGVLAICQFKVDLGRSGVQDNTEACHGTFVGSLVAGYIADLWGRRNAVILGCVIYIVGVVLQTAAQSIDLLSIGRSIAGLGVGFESCVVIAYASEISPKAIRGRVIGAYQWMITRGMFVSATVAYGTNNRTDSGAYRIPIGLQFAVMKGGKDMAIKSLARLRGLPPSSAEIAEEYAELNRCYEVERAATSGSGWLSCFKGGFKKGSNLQRTAIGTSLQMMQQLTGVNFIFYFGTTFFKSIGISNAFKISIIISAVNFASSITLFFTIDRFGHRYLLLRGSLAQAICLFIVAIVGTVLHDNQAAQIILIVFVCLYIFSFASSWGLVCWTLTGEIYPLPIRSRGIALSTASNWLCNFIIAFTTPYLVGENKANLGAKVFFIWGGTCLASFFYVYFFVPETQGLSLEEVNTMMKETNPRNSASWKTDRMRVDEQISDDNGSGQSMAREDSSKSSRSFRRWFNRKRSQEKTEVQEVEHTFFPLSTPERQV